MDELVLVDVRVDPLENLSRRDRVLPWILLGLEEQVAGYVTDLFAERSPARRQSVFRVQGQRVSLAPWLYDESIHDFLAEIVVGEGPADFVEEELLSVVRGDHWLAGL